jgi:predicted phosphoribosyltransferase/dienelactone hydrolase
MLFKDRIEAGARLAADLQLRPYENPIVLGLPRGGVPVAFEVALALRAPLDIILVRKLGVPFQPELAMGAIGEDGVRVLNDDVVRASGVTADEIALAEQSERARLEDQAARFRPDMSRRALTGRTAIIVDDGIATGSTVSAAIQVARAQGAARVVVAVPVAPPSTIQDLADQADDVVAVQTPEAFHAVGLWYDDFTQVSDDEVIDLLRRSRQPVAERDRLSTRAVDDPPLRDEEVLVPVGPIELSGHLVVPEEPIGLVIFAHGSGSSRLSPRNRSVARQLNDAHLGTLLFDLLTPEEAPDRSNVFDVELLGHRLLAATRWLRDQPESEALRIGYFGASTGGGAALWAAASPGNEIGAVVSRGGRPDLAAGRLPHVESPTLLIVGGLDGVVIDLNLQAALALRCEHRVEIVEGATHLFEEPGTLQQVADLTADWFVAHLPGTPADLDLGLDSAR